MRQNHAASNEAGRAIVAAVAGRVWLMLSLASPYPNSARSPATMNSGGMTSGRAAYRVGTMLQALRSVFLAIALFSTAAGAAEIKPFAREDMASDAVRLTEALRITTASIGAEVKDKTPDQLRKAAAAAVAAGDFAGAEKLAVIPPVFSRPEGSHRYRSRRGSAVVLARL